MLGISALEEPTFQDRLFRAAGTTTTAQTTKRGPKDSTIEEMWELQSSRSVIPHSALIRPELPVRMVGASTLDNSEKSTAEGYYRREAGEFEVDG